MANGKQAMAAEILPMVFSSILTFFVKGLESGVGELDKLRNFWTNIVQVINKTILPLNVQKFYR